MALLDYVSCQDMLTNTAAATNAVLMKRLDERRE